MELLVAEVATKGRVARTISNNVARSFVCRLKAYMTIEMTPPKGVAAMVTTMKSSEQRSQLTWAVAADINMW